MLCSTISTPDIDFTSVKARPRFLSSEFSNITIINVYIRPSENFATSDQILKCTITDLQKENPQTYFLVVGDINRDHINMIETMGFQNIVNFCTYPQSNSIVDAVYIRVTATTLRHCIRYQRQITIVTGYTKVYCKETRRLVKNKDAN
ncbi:hypothetical protein HOLleu_02604 [Holothuria leucospilota]|uniref:Uncharacterized protein n=1 Tax=Holothuria leucospilota TaxID=206669 RepID=A0A9Q1CQW8_HOLLE|nr:hypothetical protein HOLleu_02604 [Holothuria leucospilota]